MKPAAEITDRAKRYRANRQPPQGPRRCTFCASRQNVDIDHITGDETDDEPENLMYLCRPCNTAKGITQARNRIGTRTRQYNPAQAPTFAQFKQHAAVLLGKAHGSAAAATAAIRATPPRTRAQFAAKIAQANPFKSDAQRRKFFAMAERGEISRATLEKFSRDNPAAPSYQQYGWAVAHHDKRTHAHDEGGAIIHATPKALRHRYAQQIARTKADRRGTVPF